MGNLDEIKHGELILEEVGSMGVNVGSM